MLKYISSFIFSFLLISCSNSTNNKNLHDADEFTSSTNKVILSSEIVWEKLNPARGDQSPQAGTIWGNRKDTLPTGFLAKFVDGFSSPPHIHNVTYRAVVIKGLIHNDDQKADKMWLSPSSFWTQPVGQSHITAAKGEECIALVEIDKGPYLVKPIDEAFDNGDKPINIDASNIVWLNNTKTNWIGSNSMAELSFLLEGNQLKSLFVKLPKGYSGEIETTGTVLHAVVIKGNLRYIMPRDKITKALDVGSYFGATEKATHTVFNNSEEDMILYVRTNGQLFLK